MHPSYYYRYLASKTFDSGVTTKTSTSNGLPVYTSVISSYDSVDETEYPVEIVKSLPKSVTLSAPMKSVYSTIKNDKLLSAITTSVDGTTIIPLCQQFNFKAGESFNNYNLNKELDGFEIKTLWDLLNNEMYKKTLCNCAREMFPNTNPNTGSRDVGLEDRFFTHLIPLVTYTGVVPAQITSDGMPFFNEDGVVSVAEFIDSLNAIKYGSNSNKSRKDSLDGVARESDYFSEGYNYCVDLLSSPMYALYTREELVKPITRLELAYITVICWSDFMLKTDVLYGGKYALGINVDWNNPSKYMSKFSDGFDYKVVMKKSNVGSVEFDISHYNLGMSMTEYKEQIKSGIRGIPLPMFMSLVELDVLDLFYFEGKRLDPLREVSRGELTYFITKLAKEFPMKFFSSGDNTY